MNQTQHVQTRISLNDYCSQSRMSLAPIPNVAVGVETIARILNKDVLCRHDVEDINHANRSISLLEREVKPGDESEAVKTLQNVVVKVSKIADAKTIKLSELITLYHLQNFIGCQAKARASFQKIRASITVTPELCENLATLLPCCNSEKQFDEDVKTVIGINLNEKTTKILKEKKNQLKSNHQKIKTEAKTYLTQLRQNDTQKYPAYFEELLDQGYFHLFNHLIEMKALPNRNARESKIKQMSFSDFCHIALEIRKAVTQKVIKALSGDPRRIVFLLGGSGVGKSTTFCLLRGDVLVEENFNYKSQNDKDQLIGNDGATSRTFLPSIAIIDDFVVVDFAGFEDSHGQIVSIGMELALKALIDLYHPQVIVFESITNFANRFANASRLGSELDRILKNREVCALAITKYCSDSHFQKIRTIETEQKRKRENPTESEIQLKAKIEALSGLNLPTLLPQIIEWKKELQKLLEEKQKLTREPLPDTSEKKESRKFIEERENELMNAIRLKNCIRLSDFNAQLRSSFIKKLTTATAVSNHADRKLKPEDEDLLDKLFNDSLKKEIMRKQNYYLEFETIKDFESCVLKMSLIDAICARSNPEIGQFFHLPEMDPMIVRRYDKKIVDGCIDDYVNFIIRTLNLPLFEKIVQEMNARGASLEQLATLRGKLNAVVRFVTGILGKKLEDRQNVENEWAKMRLELEQVEKKVEERFNISPLLKFVLCIPLGVPFAILKFVQWYQTKEATQEALEKTIKDFSEELDTMLDTLERLNSIQKVIHRRIFDPIN